MTRYLSYEILDRHGPRCSLCHGHCTAYRNFTVKTEHVTARLPICSSCVVTIIVGVKGTNENQNLSVASRDRGSYDRQSSHRLRRGHDQ